MTPKMDPPAPLVRIRSIGPNHQHELDENSKRNKGSPTSSSPLCQEQSQLHRGKEQWSLLTRVFSGDTTSTTVASTSWEDDDDNHIEHHGRPMLLLPPKHVLPTLVEHHHATTTSSTTTTNDDLDNPFCCDDDSNNDGVCSPQSIRIDDDSPTTTMTATVESDPNTGRLLHEQKDTNVPLLHLKPQQADENIIHHNHNPKKTVIETGGPIAVVAWNHDHEPDGLVVWMDTDTNGSQQHKTSNKNNNNVDDATKEVGTATPDTTVISPKEDEKNNLNSNRNVFMADEERYDQNIIEEPVATDIDATVASWETIDLITDVEEEKEESTGRCYKKHDVGPTYLVANLQDACHEEVIDESTPQTTDVYYDDQFLTCLSFHQDDKCDTEYDSGVVTAPRSNLPTTKSSSDQESIIPRNNKRRHNTMKNSNRSTDHHVNTLDGNHIHRLHIPCQNNGGMEENCNNDERNKDSLQAIIDRVPTTEENNVWLVLNNHVTDAASDVAVAFPPQPPGVPDDEEAQLTLPSTDTKVESKSCQHNNSSVGDSELCVVPMVEGNQARSEIRTGTDNELQHRRCSTNKTKSSGSFSYFHFIMSLYGILGVLFDVITDIVFFVDFNHVHQNWQGLKIVLMASILLPGTVLTSLWIRHHFPQSSKLFCCGGKASGITTIVSQIFYWSFVVISSFVCSWPLFIVFLVADLAAILVGPEVYFCLLRMAPEDYLQVRRLVYSLCEDPTQLLVQFYLLSSGRVHGATLGCSMFFTVLNLAKTIYTLWKQRLNFQGSEVSLLLYVKNITGIVPKDARFAAAYAKMLRKDSFPYEHIILNYAGLCDSDLVNLIDALVEASVTQKHHCCKIPNTLQLRGNHLGDLSVFQLASQLKCLPCLEIIDLAENCFGDLGAEALAESIQNADCASLRVLIIECNENITRRGYHCLARAIRCAFRYQTLLLEILVMDHKGSITELLREACIDCRVDIFSPIMEPSTRHNKAEMDSDATVVGSVQLATRYSLFGRRRV